jgi:hypothetical protein
MMPSADFNALLQRLTDPALHGPRMLVLGQPFFLSTGSMFDRNPPDFTTQYQRLFRALGACPYDVMIVSGDVHYSRLIRQPVGNGSVYELISSPMCHIPTKSSLVDGIVGGRAVQDRAKVSRPPHGNTAWATSDDTHVAPAVPSHVRPARAPSACPDPVWAHPALRLDATRCVGRAVAEHPGAVPPLSRFAPGRRPPAFARAPRRPAATPPRGGPPGRVLVSAP